MRVRVKLFAAVRQQAGHDVVQVELPESATVAELRDQLVAQFPALQSGVLRLLFAVNQQYAPDDLTLQPADEIASFPPVSGG